MHSPRPFRNTAEREDVPTRPCPAGQGWANQPQTSDVHSEKKYNPTIDILLLLYPPIDRTVQPQVSTIERPPVALFSTTYQPSPRGCARTMRETERNQAIQTQMSHDGIATRVRGETRHVY